MSYICEMCNVGLDDEAPEWRTVMFSNPQTLAIDPMNNGTGDRKEVCCVSQCGHLFHKRCLTTVCNFYKKLECNVCKNSFTWKSLVRVKPTPISADAVSQENAIEEKLETLESKLVHPTETCEKTDCRSVYAAHDTLVDKFNSLAERYNKLLAEKGKDVIPKCVIR